MKILSPHKCLHRTTAVLGLRKARMAVRIRLEARHRVDVPNAKLTSGASTGASNHR